MQNELMWVLNVALSLVACLGIYKLFGKIGLFAWIALMAPLANIFVLQRITFLGLTLTGGPALFATIFLATDILNEVYGAKEARKGVFIGFFTAIFSTLLIVVSLNHLPAASDWATPHMTALLAPVWRITAASLTAYLVGNLLDIKVFDKLKSKDGEKRLWLRNNASTIFGTLVDNVIFFSIAFIGSMPLALFIQVLITRFVFKALISLMDTPVVYWARKTKRIVFE